MNVYCASFFLLLLALLQCWSASAFEEMTSQLPPFETLLMDNNTDSSNETKKEYFNHKDIIRLKKHIFKDYDKTIKPTNSTAEAYAKSFLALNVDMFPLQFLDFNEKDQYISISLAIILRYTNEQISWNPEEFGKITAMYVPHGSLWKPDFFLFNQLNFETSVTQHDFVTGISHSPNGAEVLFIDHIVPSVRCNYYAKFFPFDIQICTLEFAVIGYTNENIGYYLLTGEQTEEEKEQEMIESIEQSRGHGIWEILRFKRDIVKHSYSSQVAVHLIVRRKPLYYIVNLVLPTFIIGQGAIVGFFTPSSSGKERSEKVEMGLGALLAMVVMLIIVTDTLPTTSDYVPIISIYFMFILLIILCCLLLSTLNLSLHRRGMHGHPFPNRLRKIFFGRVARLLRVRIPKRPEERKSKEFNDAENNSPSSTTTTSNDQSEEVINSDIDDNSSLERLRMRWIRNVSSVLDDIRDLLREAGGVETEEWVVLAEVMDRVGLVLFSLLLLLSTLLFLLLGLFHWNTLHFAHPELALN